MLVPRDSSHEALKVAQVFPMDAEFSEWLYTSIARSRGCSGIKSEIRKNIHLGATPGDRIKTLATGRRMAAILSAITAVLITDYGDGLWSAIPVILLEEAA